MRDAAPVLDESFAITVWGSLTDPQGTRQEETWPTLLGHGWWRRPVVLVDKVRARGWSPAIFAGDRRAKAGVEAVFALVLDYEAAEGEAPTSIDDALDLWRGCLGLLHTSYSHTPERPRFRVIVALSRAVTGAEYGPLWRWAATRCAEAGHQIDEACRDPSRLWFLPAVPPGGELTYQSRALDGGPLDVDAALAEQREREAPPPQPAPRPRTSAAPAEGFGPERFCARALEGAVDDVRRAPKGSRHNTLRAKAYQLGGLLHYGTLSADQIEAALLGVTRAASWADEPKNLDTIRSGLRAGARAPRQVPELRFTPRAASGEAAPSDEPGQAPPDPEAPKPLPLGMRSVGDWTGPPPPVPWLCKRLHLAPGRPTGIIGYAGSGKTLLAADLVLSVATGTPAWGGIPVDRSGRVLLLDLEVGEYLTRQRLTRLAAGRGLDLATLAARIFFACFPPLSLQDGAAEAALTEALTGFDLVVIDSLAKPLAGFDENSSSVSHLMGILARASEVTGCAVVVLHHEGKPPAEGQREARFRGRGSSAIQGEWSSQWVVDSRGEGQLVLEHGKSQWGALQESWSCRIVDEGDKDPESGMTPGVRLSCLTETGAPITPEVVEGGAVERCKRSILDLLGALGAMASGDLLGKVKGNKEAKSKALTDLVGCGRVVRAREWRTVWFGLPGCHFPIGAKVDGESRGNDDSSGESRWGDDR